MAVIMLGSLAHSALAQEGSHQETRLEHYLRHAHFVASFPLTFPGPDGGYTMVHIPVVEVTKYGDTVAQTHAFLIDVGTANQGNFLPADSTAPLNGYVAWNFKPTSGGVLHVSLAPMNTHAEYRKLDSTYFGTLGYAFLKDFLSVFDYKEKKLTLYTLYSSINIADRDTMALQLPYFDDAFLTYCHCPYPTIWIDAAAPPLKAGRVHLGLASPRSSIYQPALDTKTRKQLSKAMQPDSLTGKVPSVGLSLATFDLMGNNIAWRNPHRIVEAQPAVFRDLSIFILGSIGNDVLRTFSGLIIDPVRTKLVLVK